MKKKITQILVLFCFVGSLMAAPTSPTTTTTTTTTTAVPLVEANALNFDGVNDFVTISDNDDLDLLTGWTLETWVKHDVTGVQHGLIEKYHWAAGQGSYVLRIAPSGKAQAWVIKGTSYNNVTGTNSLATDTWYHIAATFDPNTDSLKIYVNGVLEGTNSLATLNPVPSTNDVKLGCRGDDNALKLNGSMDKVRIWGIVRTQAEIQAAMNCELSIESGLVASYNFNQGSAGGDNDDPLINTLNDASGNGNHGTLNNFALVVGTSSNWVDGLVNVLDDATFNYTAAAAAYCVDATTDPTPTITGLAGGTFSSGVGLSINGSTGKIDASASTPGTYTVTYTTAGICSNSSDVNVTINALPVVTFIAPASPYCPATTSILSGGSPTGGVYSGTGVTFDGTTSTYSFTSPVINDSSPTTITITYTYTDGNGCENSVSDDITVQDNTSPTAIAQDITVTLDEFGAATIAASDINNGSSDNCSIASLSVSPDTFDCTNIGIPNPVTLTVTDPSGNTHTDTANVTVLEHWKDALDLRELKDFAVFSGTGAITNLGTVNGDVGTNTGAITGAGVLSGTIYKNTALTVKADIDLLKVYINLNNILETHPGTHAAHAPAFGTETISPGVYSIGSAGTLAGNLTLDGGNDSEALFIIKFKGAFTVGAGSTITLINGAKAKNVYWLAQGAVSIGASSVIQGSIFSFPGAITLGINSTITGRLISSVGAIIVSAGAEVDKPLDPIISINPMKDNAPAAAVDVLGTIEDFSLFTSSGAVTNTSTSGIFGNIGTDFGAISGFATSSLIGSEHTADAVTSQAKTDLDTAYNALNALIVISTKTLHTPTFGSGETLYAGVYDIPSAGSLAGTITLDGQNNADAIFIFRFNGAFGAAALSKVILSGGTLRSNVFWIAEGAVSIGSFSTIKGTILAHGGAAMMGAGGNLEGRMLSTAGAIGFSTGVVYTVVHDVECEYPSTSPRLSGEKKVVRASASIINNLLIYPNPSNGVFKIKLKNTNVAAQLLLFDVLGKLVERRDVTAAQATQPILMDKSFLQSGVYLLKIINKDEVVTKKIIIKR
jgi:hypothetical protein